MRSPNAAATLFNEHTKNVTQGRQDAGRGFAYQNTTSNADIGRALLDLMSPRAAADTPIGRQIKGLSREQQRQMRRLAACVGGHMPGATGAFKLAALIVLGSYCMTMTTGCALGNMMGLKTPLNMNDKYEPEPVMAFNPETGKKELLGWVFYTVNCNGEKGAPYLASLLYQSVSGAVVLIPSADVAQINAILGGINAATNIANVIGLLMGKYQDNIDIKAIATAVSNIKIGGKKPPEPKPPCGKGGGGDCGHDQKPGNQEGGDRGRGNHEGGGPDHGGGHGGQPVHGGQQGPSNHEGRGGEPGSHNGRPSHGDGQPGNGGHGGDRPGGGEGCSTGGGDPPQQAGRPSSGPSWRERGEAAAAAQQQPGGMQ